MEKYTTGTDQRMMVHSKDVCNGKFCSIHNPSMTWPTHWRDDARFMEYMCPCGVGYPVPEQRFQHGGFGTCGNPECLAEYQRACIEVGDNKKEDSHE
jgi:hypothetical protein